MRISVNFSEMRINEMKGVAWRRKAIMAMSGSQPSK